MTRHSYQSHILISLKTLHMCCLFYIELSQIVCDPYEIHFMLLRSRSHTLHIYSCWLLHWKLRKNMPSIHTKILHHFDMTLRVAKIIWAMQKKSRRKIYVPRSMGKKKKKKEKESLHRLSLSCGGSSDHVILFVMPFSSCSTMACGPAAN